MLIKLMFLKNKRLTTPTASKANSTVPKNNGNVPSGPIASRVLIGGKSSKIYAKIIPIPINVITFANVENGASTFKFLMQFRKINGNNSITIWILTSNSIQ